MGGRHESESVDGMPWNRWSTCVGISRQVRFLRLPEVLARTGLSRSTIYVRLEQGRFPRPVSLGGRAVGWIESEVDGWIRERIAASRRNAE